MKKIEYDTKEQHLYLQFTEQLNAWNYGGKLPDVASQDLKYYLGLKKKKIKSRGLLLKDKIQQRGLLQKPIAWSDKSEKYTSIWLGGTAERETEFYRDKKKVFSKKENVNLYNMVLNANYHQIHDEENYNCPGCGGVSAVGKLKEGCSYCGAKFSISQLFPKVTNYYFLRDHSKTDNEMGVGILKYSIICAIILFIMMLVIQYRNNGSFSLELILVNLIGVLGGAIFLGYIAYSLSLLGGVFKDAVKSTPLLFSVAGDKKKLKKFMEKHDPEFSYEYFESRVLSMLNIMLYRDKEDVVVYEGEKSAPEFDVVDAVYRGGMNIKKYWIEGEDCYVNVEVYMTAIHDSGEKLKAKDDTYCLTVVRKLKGITDMGFSIRKITCPSCGASFDATKERDCPYCSTKYVLRNDDWVIAEIGQR